MSALLDVSDVTMRFGGFRALSEVSLAVGPGERVGLIGPNGSGKTTLINCVSGVLRPNRGRVVFRGRDVSRLAPHRRTRLGIARSFQIPRPFATLSLIDNLRVPLAYVAHGDEAAALRDAHALLDRFGLAAQAERPAGGLSQVELRKLELARAMAARPALLISDEAMAGLTAGEADEILAILLSLNREDGVAVIMIEHMMRAIMRFSERVLCLDAGRLIAQGAPADVVAHPDVRRAYLGA